MARLADHMDSSPWSAAQHLVEDQSCETAGEVESGLGQDPGCGGSHQEGVPEQRQAPVAAAAAAEPVVLVRLCGGRDGVPDAGVAEVALVAFAVGEAVAG